MMRWLLLVLILAAIAPKTSWAQGDPLAMPTEPKAVEHLNRGDAHFRLREFKEAVEEYRAGARIEPTPRFLYNLGQSFRQLKDYENAIWYFTQWIKAAKPPEEMRLPIEQVIAKMRDEMEKAATTTPPTEPAGPPHDRDAQTSGLTPRRKLAIGLAGLGAIALGAGIVFGVQASGLEDDFYETCPASPCAEAAEANAIADRAESRALLANIAFGVAATAAAGAALLWFTGGPESLNPARTTVTPHVTATFVGVGIRGWF